MDLRFGADNVRGMEALVVHRAFPVLRHDWYVVVSRVGVKLDRHVSCVSKL